MRTASQFEYTVSSVTLKDLASIVPWYQPLTGDKPLASNDKLIIGHDDGEERIVIKYPDDRNRDSAYSKVFMTQERTDFFVFRQWFRHWTEGIVRDICEMNPPGLRPKTANLQWTRTGSLTTVLWERPPRGHLASHHSPKVHYSRDDITKARMRRLDPGVERDLFWGGH